MSDAASRSSLRFFRPKPSKPTARGFEAQIKPPNQLESGSRYALSTMSMCVPLVLNRPITKWHMGTYQPCVRINIWEVGQVSEHSIHHAPLETPVTCGSAWGWGPWVTIVWVCMCVREFIYRGVCTWMCFFDNVYMNVLYMNVYACLILHRMK